MLRTASARMYVSYAAGSCEGAARELCSRSHDTQEGSDDFLAEVGRAQQSSIFAAVLLLDSAKQDSTV
jgi:hypothetical protein